MRKTAKFASTLLLTAGLAARLTAADSTNWIAFNDHASGTGTAPNVTTFSPGITAGTAVGGNLVDFNSGGTLPIGVTIMPSGGSLNGNTGSSSAPNAGSPADQLFGGKVEWTASAYYFGADPYTAALTLTFTNLDPGKRYVFRGTAVRGNNYANRWMGVFLEGAQSSVPAHITGEGSPGIVTNGWAPYGDLLPPGTAAIYNTGHNLAGDVIGWDEIVPASDGTFSIINTNALGTTTTPHYPNNQSRSTYGYAFAAWMLAEVGEATPVEFVAQPAPVTVDEFRPFSLSVTVRGSLQGYQWYKDGLPIEGATTSTYAKTQASVDDSGDYYVVVTGALNTITSETVRVTVNDDTTAPTVVSVVASSPTNIVIAFSEIMDMSSEGVGQLIVDAANWFVGNGVSMVYPTNRNTAVVLELYDPLAEDSDVGISFDSAYDLAGNMLSIAETVHTWKASPCAGLTFEVYTMQRELDTGVTDNNITNLLYDPNYLAGRPRAAYTLSAFDTRQVFLDDTQEHYGGRVYGLFIAPRTGNWKFYLRSDDSSQLWFNPAGPAAAGAVKVAEQTGCCNNFTDAPGTLSTEAFALVAGQAYYIEGLFKEGTGGDYIQVAAALEGDPAPATPANNGICDSCIPAAWTGATWAPASLVANLSITQEPTDATLVENSTNTFSVRVQSDIGAALCYQWRSNGVDIAGATGPTYTQVADLGASGSAYSVLISSIGGATVTSREAILTVNNDVTPPTVVSVTADSTLTNVVVTFSEPMNALLAADNANYTIDGQLAALATVTSPTVVTLNPAEPLATCVNHVLSVANVTDLANLAVSPSPTEVTFSPEIAQVLLAPGDATLWAFDQSGTDRSNAWYVVDFDDSAWPRAGQLFDAKSTPRDAVSGIPVTTQLSLTNENWSAGTANVPTYYFRTHFRIPVSLDKVKSLRLEPIVDDGLVLFLNGEPVFSTASSLTNAPFSAYYPGSAVGDANYGAAVDLAVSNLVSGDNVLAAEVKNQSATSSDVSFGLRLTVIQTECGAPEVRVNMARTGTGTEITWTEAGVVLEAAPAITGPWAPVDGATSPYAVTPTESMRFFRLVKP